MWLKCVSCIYEYISNAFGEFQPTVVHTRDDYLLLWQRLPATWLLLTSTSAVNRSQNLSSRCWYSFEIYEFITSYSNISMIWFLLLRNWSIEPINIINSWIGFLIIPYIISIRTKIISELNERKVEKSRKPLVIRSEVSYSQTLVLLRSASRTWRTERWNVLRTKNHRRVSFILKSSITIIITYEKFYLVIESF